MSANLKTVSGPATCHTRTLEFDAVDWVWCQQCDAPTRMTQHGRCQVCGSEAVAWLYRLQVGEEEKETAR